MNENMTMIKISKNTRLKLKTQALQRGMTMIDYVDYLVGKDKGQIAKIKKGTDES